MRILVLVLLFIAHSALATLEKAGEEFARGNYTEAAKLLAPLAEAGDVRAQMNLGSMYSNGLGVPRDPAKAAYWTRRAAEAGNPKAQANLGLLYLHGIGLPQDDRQAAEWLGRAVDQGNAGAQNTMCVLLLEGRGVPQNYERARKLFDAAIRGGEVAAANNLARMVEQGLGGKADLKAALGLYEIAAKNGDAAAQNRVGLAYLNGELRPRDRQTAREWLQKSANQGEKYGQFHLGMLLAEDNAADPLQAIMWLALSAQQGHSPAQSELDARNASLSEAQRDRLRQLVSQWRPTGRGAFDPAVRSLPGVTAQAQPLAAERLAKARQLYACSSFFSEGSKSADASQNEKLRRISRHFLAQATVEVIAADENKDIGNTELAQKTGKLGEADFKAFMASVGTLPSQAERNEKIGRFVSSCGAAGGLKQP